MLIFFNRFGYVDLADPDDLDKAVALSGENIGGSTCQIERAKPKGTPKTPRDDTSKSPGGRGGGNLVFSELCCSPPLSINCRDVQST